VNEIKKDSIYFKTSNGGATFSGGEPLLHIAELQPVLDELGACGIHRAVETSLFVTGQLLSQALNLIDLFIVDVKILDENLCYNVIGGQLNTYLSNVNVLDRAGIPYWLRFPAIPGLTYDKENIEAVRNFIERHHPEKVQILPAHNLGASKYESLGNIPPRLTTPDLSVLKDVWRGSTFPYEVLSL
jgi:pyruvate formate lyase activating enzyme